MDSPNTLTGYISVQLENNGKTTEDRLNSISQSMVASANALRKQLEALEQSTGNPKDSGDQNNDNNVRSTDTYHFEIQPEKAIAALQAIDRVGNTEAYNLHMSKLNQVRDSIGCDPKDLPLDRKVEAFKKLNLVGFMSYSYQVSIRVPQPNNSDVFIRSKKHHRMESLSEKSAKAILDAYVSKWLETENKPESNDKSAKATGSQPEAVADAADTASK
jgi:hypothetical protein